MSHYKDVSWNLKSLMAACMSPHSAGMVAIAVSHLMEAYTKNKTSEDDPVIRVLEDCKKHAKPENVYEPNV